MAATILFTAAVAAMLAAQKQAEKPVEVRLLDITAGLDSNMPDAGIRLIRDPETWRRTWKDHISMPIINNGSPMVAVPPPPAVDFERAMILAFFDGQAQAASWKLVGSKNDQAETILRVQHVPLDSGVLGISGSPYTFMLLSRSNAKIVVEAMHGKQFQQIAEFPKLEQKPSQRSAGN